MENTDKDMILEALKLNWDHARHVENQRARLAAIYLAVVGAGVAAAVKIPLVGRQRFWALVAGLLFCLICWCMTYKWNLEFGSLIDKAEKCAKTLQVTGSDGERAKLYSYIGFPTQLTDSPPQEKHSLLKYVTVRRMFHLFYFLSAVIWLVLLYYNLPC